MTVEIKAGRAQGIMTAPPSKSEAHRMLVCAGLAVLLFIGIKLLLEGIL